MSFLAPLFLLGTLAVGLPVVFHLIRRTTRERKAFSSLMFLLPSPPRLTRRSRLEHILLLLLRCAVLCLLAAGFARPFFKRALPAQPSAARRILILMDTSASMRRAELWSDANSRAEKILHETTPADQVAIFTFDRQASPLLTFDSWNAAAPGERAGLAAAKLRGVSPGWMDTHLGSALVQAAEILADTGAAPAASELILISDLQQGSHLEPMQGYEWPRGVQLRVESVQARHRGNASLQLMPELQDAAAKTPASTLRVRVSNNAESHREQFEVGWADAEGHGFIGQPVPVYVPAGQSRVATVAVASGTSNRIMLRDDDDDFDNSVFVVPPEAEHLTVLYFGAEAANDPKAPLYFVDRAFQETRRRAVNVVEHGADAPLASAELSKAALLVINQPLPEIQASAVREHVDGGKTALFVLEGKAAAATLARLLGVGELETEEVRPSSYALLADIDFRHPILAPFADPRFSDFTQIHFWKYCKLNANALPAARVLARFDTGDPALLEVAMGKGKVLVLTSGWQPEESQLALSTKFVPLLYSILEQGGAPAPVPPQFQVGDPIPIASFARPTDSPLAVRCPDGSEVKLGAAETNFTRTFLPGVYTLESQPPKRFAVNLNPTESLTMPLAIDDLERLGAPVMRSAVPPRELAGRKARLANAELENRQKLWRWVLIGALAVLVGETWLGGWAARRRGAPASALAGPSPQQPAT